MTIDARIGAALDEANQATEITEACGQRLEEALSTLLTMKETVLDEINEVLGALGAQAEAINQAAAEVSDVAGDTGDSRLSDFITAAREAAQDLGEGDSHRYLATAAEELEKIAEEVRSAVEGATDRIETQVGALHHAIGEANEAIGR